MMIEPYLAAWLKDTSNGDTSNSTRQTARTALNTLVGSRVFLGRRAPTSEGDYQLTLQRVTATRWNDLAGEDVIVRPVIQVSAWGKGDNAAWDTMQACRYVREALAGYRGDMVSTNPTSTVYVLGVAVLRDSMTVPGSPPNFQIDTGWNYQWSLDVEIVHRQTAV